jgi:hypothetical protein
MEHEKHIKLAQAVVAEGVPFSSEGIFGIRKGHIVVQNDSGRLHLICRDLMPVELIATGIPEHDETLKSIKLAIEKVRTGRSETQHKGETPVR